MVRLFLVSDFIVSKTLLAQLFSTRFHFNGISSVVVFYHVFNWINDLAVPPFCWFYFMLCLFLLYINTGLSLSWKFLYFLKISAFYGEDLLEIWSTLHLKLKSLPIFLFYKTKDVCACSFASYLTFKTHLCQFFYRIYVLTLLSTLEHWYFKINCLNYLFLSIVRLSWTTNASIRVSIYILTVSQGKQCFDFASFILSLFVFTFVSTPCYFWYCV